MPSEDLHHEYIKLEESTWATSTDKLKSIVWHNSTGAMAGLGATYDGTTGKIQFHSMYNSGYYTESDIIMSVNGNGRVGIGTTSPRNTLQLFNGNESITQTNFTQTVDDAGLLISTGYTNNSFTPGVFWITEASNPTKPKAGIYTKNSGSGTSMYFGTSNAYLTGITNDAMVIDPSGDVGIGTSSPSGIRLHVQDDAGATSTPISYLENSGFWLTQQPVRILHLHQTTIK